jgi:hypothetical protein
MGSLCVPYGHGPGCREAREVFAPLLPANVLDIIFLSSCKGLILPVLPGASRNTVCYFRVILIVFEFVAVSCWVSRTKPPWRAPLTRRAQNPSSFAFTPRLPSTSSRAS